MNFFNQYSDVMIALWEHLEITSLAIGASILFGIPLGILISKKKSLAKSVLGIAGVFQTVPSLALFGLIIPLLGIGIIPSIAVLFLYGLLPIITNTFIGISEIDENLLEAAKGMGMSKMQRLFKVELPLSIPTIMGGIKISSVTCIGTATIAALIGAGGLGTFIFRGIASGNNTLILKGAIPSALLAIFVSFILGLIERALKPLQSSHNIDVVHKFKKIIIAFGISLFILPLLFSGLKQYDNLKAKKNTIIIGHKNYTEQRVLGQMYSILIEEYTDYNTKVLEFGGTQIIFQALTNHEIDIYPEYTGSAYSAILNKTEVFDSETTYNIVAKDLKELYDVEMLNTLKFNNTYVFLAKPEFAKKYGIEKLSDLKKYKDNFSLAAPYEFLDRKDGLPGIKLEYGISFKDPKGMDLGLVLKALESDKTDIGIGYGTDGRIKKEGFKIIEDDKNFFPPYNIAPIINNNFKGRFPEAMDAIKLLVGKISNEKMQELNLKATESDGDLGIIVEKFLKEEGFIK